MTVADVKPVLVPNVVRGADEFAAGRADVGFFALGAAKVKEVDVQVGGIRFIPMDASPGAVEAMQKAVQTAYLGRAEPSPARPPTTTSPVPIPTRAARGSPAGVVKRPTAWTAASPARTDRSASSSWALGHPKQASTPSPMNLARCPSNLATSPATASW